MKPFTRATYILALIVISLAPSVSGAEPAPLWYRNFLIEGGLTLVTQNTVGNEYDTVKDQIDFVYTADLLITGNIDDHQEVFFAFEAGDGHAINDNIGSRAVVNYDAYITDIGGMTRINLSQAYYKYRSPGDTFHFHVGRMDFHAFTDTNEFAGDETRQFLNGMFVRSTGPVFHELPTYYANAICVMVHPVGLLSFNAAYATPDGFDIVDKKYVVAQFGLHPVFGEGWEGNYRFGYLIYKNEFTKISDGAAVTNSGFYASLDQALSSSFGVFVRFAQQDDKIAQNEVISALSGGISINNLLGNEGNGVGLAYGVMELNTDLVKENNVGMDVMELYVRFGLSEKTELTLDIQRLNDLERPTKRTVYVGGLRFQANM